MSQNNNKSTAKLRSLALRSCVSRLAGSRVPGSPTCKSNVPGAMLNPDRDTIELNIGGLVRATDYKRLMECCLEQRILFDVMREKIEVSACVHSAHTT